MDIMKKNYDSSKDPNYLKYEEYSVEDFRLTFLENTYYITYSA